MNGSHSKNFVGILCWNVQKRTLDPSFVHAFVSLFHTRRIDLVALQEVRWHEGLHPPFLFNAFERAASCNIRLAGRRYGVMTLSSLPLQKSLRYLSGVREAGIVTRKSALLTRHALPDGEDLALLNLHAVNFVPYRLFAAELERIAELIETVRERRVVVAGDFNTWSEKRQKRLGELMEAFGLLRVAPRNERGIKSVLGRPLDHIYFRGLELVEAEVPETEVSDHNPIYALFRYA